VLRTVMAVEPLCDGPPEAVRTGLRQLFETALAAG
jgi:hypothetical protein